MVIHLRIYTNSYGRKNNGEYAFVCHEAGNLVKKGNTFKISRDTVTYTATSGEGVEYWQYTYDLLNRLTEKNGTAVADYESIARRSWKQQKIIMVLIKNKRMIQVRCKWK